MSAALRGRRGKRERVKRCAREECGRARPKSIGWRGQDGGAFIYVCIYVRVCAPAYKNKKNPFTEVTERAAV